jgi:branched-chain amino acid transport system substrate-binding protein
MALRRRFGLVALACTIALIGAACGDDDDNDAASTPTSAPSADRGNLDGALKVGLLMPQSGDLSAILDALVTPIQMAIDEINAAGGVNGQQVASVQKDDGGGSNTDIASASLDTLLTSDRVDLVLGPASSTTTLGIIDKVGSNRVLECSGSNTAGELSVEGGAAGGYYFRTAPPDSLQGPALAQTILADNRARIAILTRNDSYGTGFGDVLETTLTDGGAEVIENAAYDPRAADFRADVQKVAGKGADAIVLIAFPDDGAKVLKEMIAQNVGPDDVQIYVADGMQSSKLAAGVDPANPGAIEGIKGTAPAANPGGVNHPFGPAYAKTGKDTIFSPYYYDCMLIAALAAQAAGSDDPTQIKDKVEEVTTEGTKCQTFKACLDLLKAGTDIDYDGASGPVDFNSKHEPSRGVYDVWEYNAEGKSGNVEGADQITIDESDL